MDRIHELCFSGKLKEVQRTLKKFPFKVYELDGIYERNCFIFASLKGHSKLVEYLMGVEDNDVNHLDHFGYSALHYACSNGHSGVVKVLLTSPVINKNCQQNPGKLTPLMLACMNSDAESAKLLLSAYANPNLLNSSGESVFSMPPTDILASVLQNYRNGLFQIWKGDIYSKGELFRDTKRELQKYLDKGFISTLMVNNIIRLSTEKPSDCPYLALLIACLLNKKKLDSWSLLYKKLSSILEFDERVYYLLEELIGKLQRNAEKYGTKLCELYRIFRFLNPDSAVPVEFVRRMWGVATLERTRLFLRKMKKFRLVKYSEVTSMVRLSEYCLKFLERAVKGSEEHELKVLVLERLFGKMDLVDEGGGEEEDGGEGRKTLDTTYEISQELIVDTERMNEHCFGPRDAEKVRSTSTAAADEDEIPDDGETQGEGEGKGEEKADGGHEDEPGGEEKGEESGEKENEEGEQEEEEGERSKDIEIEPTKKVREYEFEIDCFKAEWKHALIIGNLKTGHLPRIYQAEADCERLGKLLEAQAGFTTHVLKGATQQEILTELQKVLEIRMEFVRENPDSTTCLLLYYCGYLINGRVCGEKYNRKRGRKGISLKYMYTLLDESDPRSEEAANYVFLHTRDYNEYPKTFVGSSQFLIVCNDMDERMMHSLYGQKSMYSRYCSALCAAFKEFYEKDVEEIPKSLRIDFPSTRHFSSLALTEMPIKNVERDVEDGNVEYIKFKVDFANPIKYDLSDPESEEKDKMVIHEILNEEESPEAEGGEQNEIAQSKNEEGKESIENES